MICGCIRMPTASSSSAPLLNGMTSIRPVSRSATAPTTCWFFLAQVFLQPGLEAVFSQYCFAVYPIACQMVGATARVAPALPVDHPMALGHDLRALYERVGPDTRLVFVANPNNPTGTWLDGSRLKDFVASLPPHVICVVDEAYTEYAESGTLGDASTWLNECPNLVVTRTFSKAYGLAGLRVGYALSNPGVADLLNRVRPAFNVNSLALAAARAALDDQDFIDRSRQVNSEGMIQLGEGLKALGATVIPSAANFILTGFDASGAELNEKLLREGVIVRPVGNYGLDRYLRITIGTADQNRRALAALKKGSGLDHAPEGSSGRARSQRTLSAAGRQVDFASGCPVGCRGRWPDPDNRVPGSR